MKRGIRIYFYLLAIFIAAILISALTKGNNTLSFSETVFFGYLVVSSFVFSIIIAFSIANRHSRLSDIRGALREQDAILTNIYYLSEIFGEEIMKKTREKIDTFLISQLDYKLEDFNKESPKKLRELHSFLNKLGIKNEIQTNAKDKLFDNLEDLLTLQKQVEYQVRNKMLFYEWISLLLLGGVIEFCLFYANDGSIISIIITSLLSASLVLLLLVLKELDSLKWQEQNWIWQPLSQLFSELDLLPYFPEDVFQQKRIKLEDFKEAKKIRIAHYPHPYPNMNSKTIEIVTL